MLSYRGWAKGPGSQSSMQLPRSSSATYKQAGAGRPPASQVHSCIAQPKNSSQHAAFVSKIQLAGSRRM